MCTGRASSTSLELPTARRHRTRRCNATSETEEAEKPARRRPADPFRALTLDREAVGWRPARKGVGRTEMTSAGRKLLNFAVLCVGVRRKRTVFWNLSERLVMFIHDQRPPVSKLREKVVQTRNHEDADESAH